MPLLGNAGAVERSISVPPEYWAAILMGLMLWTWRIFAASLCFARSDKRWLVEMPVLVFVATLIGAIVHSDLRSDAAYRDAITRLVSFLPNLLGLLVAAKFLLAFVGFRVSLRRRLLTPSALIGYLAVWILLVAVLLAVVLTLPSPLKEWAVPLSLGMVLFVPLARIAFCPIALERSRHA
jgi:hypothetical protein